MIRQDSGVSSVISVILLVGVTVGLVSLTTVITFDVTDDVIVTPPDAEVSLTYYEDTTGSREGYVEAEVVSNQNVDVMTVVSPTGSNVAEVSDVGDTATVDIDELGQVIVRSGSASGFGSTITRLRVGEGPSSPVIATPSIDTFSITGNSDGSTAEYDIDWEVSSGSSDLDSLDIVLVDQGGSEVDSVSRILSGTSASGTDTLSEGGSPPDQTYTVETSVRDTNGNSDSDSKSVEYTTADGTEVAFDDTNGNGGLDAGEDTYTETDVIENNFGGTNTDLVIRKNIDAGENKIEINTQSLTVRPGVSLSTTGNSNITFKTTDFLNVSGATISSGKDIIATAAKGDDSANITANNTTLRFDGNAEVSMQNGGTLFVNNNGGSRADGGTYILDQDGNEETLKLRTGNLQGSLEKGNINS